MEWKDLLFKAEELNYLELIFRTTILYFVLFLADKSLGFRQPGIVTPYNFLVAAGISHIAASRMVQPQSRPIDAIAIIVVYIALILLISYSYLKLSPYITSKKQTVLIEKGRVKKKYLRRSLLTIDNLFSILRQKNVFDLKSVDYLFAEPNGDFSVAKNSNALPVTIATMGIPTTPKELSSILIYEGRIDRKKLSEKNLDMEWVHEQLKRQNVTDISSVYIGLLNSKNELYIN
ncbi:YetF domain-containing protein [Paenisporosarcina sp.]|uniref:DUF421 domain-containing protein n=1 Tax=Paenisporosarcina sp. TaxID=1932001 RepID=UPI003C70D785